MPADSHLAPGLALIFDMDGVIVHSTPVHNEAWQVYLRTHGIEESQAAIEAKMLGKHNAEIVRIFFGDGLPAETVARHGADKETIYRELMAPQLERQLVPGVADFVRHHAGSPLAVATNAEPANVRFVLEGSGLASLFRVVIAGHEVERPKPDPQIYSEAARRLQVAPANCIVFEDSEPGVAAAQAAGMRVAGLLTTIDTLPGCDLTVSSFEAPELADWLDAARPV